MVYSFMKALLATSLLASAVCAFSVHSDKAPTLTSRFATKASASDVDFSNDRNTASSSSARRSLLFRGVAAVVATTAVAAPPALAAGTTRTKGNAALGAGTVVGREIDTFNSLIYNFKNIDLGGGLDASTLQEPSVPFVEFGEKMKAGEVTFVEFLAPSGDVAYATFKGKKGKIRIGEGYPITKKGSWSSPDYVIRSVSNFGVPYKFTVPALAKFSSN